MATIQVSEADIEFLRLIRGNINRFLQQVAALYAGGSARLLDIAPQVHDGARPFFPEQVVVETLDIDPASRCTYIGDLCKHNPLIADSSFDFVVCTEVLEHTLQPFHAIEEICRVLKPGGKLFLTTPFNFRIHGPLPDCWRFTEHGLRALLSDYRILALDALETEGRPLMPIHYAVVAEKQRK